MTRNDVLRMLASGGLENKFAEIDKSYELINGNEPGAYAVPNWLYELLKIMQSDIPRWRGRRLDPWDKDEIRGMQ